MTQEQQNFNTIKDSVALKSVLFERVHQIRKWGNNNYYNNPSMWLAIISKQVGHLSHEVLCDYEGSHNPVLRRHELVQIAACALAAIEEIDSMELSEAEIEGVDNSYEFVGLLQGEGR